MNKTLFTGFIFLYFFLSFNVTVYPWTTQGMVAYWKMDGNGRDGSGYNHHGKLSGSLLFLKGRLGKGLALDGKSSYVQIQPNKYPLDCRHQFTLEVWLKGDIFGNRYCYIFSRQNSLALSVKNGEPMIRSPQGKWLSTGIRLQPGQWYHLAWTYDGNHHKIYTDGQLKAEIQTTGTYSRGGDMYLSHPDYPFAGMLDEIKVYNSPLSALEIQCSYYEGFALAAYWPLDGNSKDDGCSGLNGEVKGHAVFRGSMVSLGLDLSPLLPEDSLKPYMVVPDPQETLTFTNALTLEVWCQPKEIVAGFQHIFVKAETYGLSLYNGKIAFWCVKDWWKPEIPALEAGKWYCITATYDGKIKRIYLNGKEVAAKKQTGFISPGGAVQIGDAEKGFHGMVDEIRVYRDALPTEVIQKNFNDIPKPMAIWTFDHDVHDHSGNGQKGKLINGPRYVKGKVNQCLYFDGNNDYVYIDNEDHQLDLGLKITLEAWIYGFHFQKEFQHIYDKYRSLSLSVKNSHLSLAGRGDWWQPSEAKLESERWYHVVGSYDYSERKLYVNGLLVGSQKVDELSAYGDGIYIGHPYFSFFGLIDELKVYNATLSARDVWVRSQINS